MKDFRISTNPKNTCKPLSSKSNTSVSTSQSHPQQPPSNPAPQKVKSSNTPTQLTVEALSLEMSRLKKCTYKQNKTIQSQQQQLKRMRAQLAILKASKFKDPVLEQELATIKQQKQELLKKVKSMQEYLAGHGLKWVGQQIQGQLDVQAIKSEIQRSKMSYSLPSLVDYATVLRRVQELNAGLEAQGLSMEVYEEKGVHKLRRALPVPIQLYANGIAIKGYSFYSYTQKQCLQILTDILDGYFPSIMKQKYPEGTLLEVVDHLEQKYSKQIIPQSEENNQSFSINEKRENQMFSLEKSWLQNNQQKNNQKSQKDSNIEVLNFFEEFQGKTYLVNNNFQDFKEMRKTESQFCFLKIRLLKGQSCLLLMLKTDKIADIQNQLSKVCKQKLFLFTNFPKKQYTGDQKESLEQLGFFPSLNLFSSLAPNLTKEQ